MKKMKHIFSFLSLLLMLSACAKDKLAENEQGTPLPDGKYPLELTVSGLEAVATPTPKSSTRGTVDGDWWNAHDVAVQVNGKVKEYKVSGYSDNNAVLVLKQALTGSDADKPFWWSKNSETKAVTAWYPFQTTFPDSWSVSLNQTKETIKNEDLMYVAETEITRANPSIAFRHLLAKVVINLINTAYVRAANVKVSLEGQYQKATFNATTHILSGEDSANKTINPYKLPTPNASYFASYQALVIPLDYSAGQNANLCIIVNGVTYKYKLSTGVSGDVFSPGHQYIYNITVKEEGLSVTVGNSIAWETGNTGSGSVTLPEKE